MLDIKEVIDKFDTLSDHQQLTLLTTSSYVPSLCVIRVYYTVCRKSHKKTKTFFWCNADE